MERKFRATRLYRVVPISTKLIVCYIAVPVPGLPKSYLQARSGGAPPARVGLRHLTIAPRGAFECLDGRQVLFSVQSDRASAVFAAKVLGQAAQGADMRFFTNVTRVAHRAELDSLIVLVPGTLNRESTMRLCPPYHAGARFGDAGGGGHSSGAVAGDCRGICRDRSRARLGGSGLGQGANC